jgi:hypothetical protein
MSIAQEYDWQNRIDAINVPRVQIAREVGVHEMTLFFIFNGTTKNPSFKTVRDIEKAISKHERRKKKILLQKS